MAETLLAAELDKKSTNGPLSQTRDAIARGADPAAVKKRLLENSPLSVRARAPLSGALAASSTTCARLYGACELPSGRGKRQPFTHKRERGWRTHQR